MAVTFGVIDGKWQTHEGSLSSHIDIQLWSDRDIIISVESSIGSSNIYLDLDDLKAIVAEHEKFLQARQICIQQEYIDNLKQQ